MSFQKELTATSIVLKHFTHPFSYHIEKEPSSSIIIPSEREKTTLVSAAVLAIGICLTARFAFKLKSRYLSSAFFLVTAVGASALYYNVWASKCRALATIQELKTNFKQNVSIRDLFKTLDQCWHQNKQIYLIQAFNMYVENQLKVLLKSKSVIELKDHLCANDLFQNVYKTFAILIKLSDKSSEKNPISPDGQFYLTEDNILSTLDDEAFRELFTNEAVKIIDMLKANQSAVQSNVKSYLGMLS